jgi:3-isopropylmalate dehydrogenase
VTVNSSFSIAVLPGDGIGREVIPSCVEVLNAAIGKVGGFTLKYEWLDAGADAYRSTGSALTAQTMQACGRADAILLGAMGLPNVRYPDGTEIAPQLDLRFEFGLYAGVRPTRALPGVPRMLADPRAQNIDFILIRESTEGLFASRAKGVIEDDREARDTMVITRDTSERLFDFSFRLAASRPGRQTRKVTCVDKANVFKSFAFFRKIFDERAAHHLGIAAEHAYVDATALSLILRPWDFDVLVTENMFGDILSDLAAGLIGGMGYAPSADIGDERAVFQPAHGTAPDIVGTGKANPVATILSGMMMLEWLGAKHSFPQAVEAAALIHRAVDLAFAGGKLVTCELGGAAGTSIVTRAVLAELASMPATAKAI